MSLERSLPIPLYSTKFSEIKAFSVKYPEFRKFPEILQPCVRGACSDPQPHSPPPQYFVNCMEILVLEVELYLESFKYEVAYAI